jgi:hypothetical protein
MVPFDVTYAAVPDERISDLLAATNAAGFPTPALVPAVARPLSIDSGRVSPMSANDNSVGDEPDLPETWRIVRELDGQSFAWPELREHYAEYRVYAGETRHAGTVHVALATAPQYKSWGRERMHVVAFLTSGSPQKPLAEFLGTDDFEENRELIAVIRGRGGPKSKKMFGPGDSLPSVYAERFRTALISGHIRVSGVWSKIGVLAREDEPDTMLDHALVQARRRGDL